MVLHKVTKNRRDDGTWEEPDGEIIQVLSEGRGNLTMLVREDSDADEAAEPDHPTNDEGEPLCVGKDDGQCSRTVEDPGEVCWQHE